jgi:hypothetical protein
MALPALIMPLLKLAGKQILKGIGKKLAKEGVKKFAKDKLKNMAIDKAKDLAKQKASNLLQDKAKESEKDDSKDTSDQMGSDLGKVVEGKQPKEEAPENPTPVATDKVAVADESADTKVELAKAEVAKVVHTKESDAVAKIVKDTDKGKKDIKSLESTYNVKIEGGKLAPVDTGVTAHLTTIESLTKVISTQLDRNNQLKAAELKIEEEKSKALAEKGKLLDTKIDKIHSDANSANNQDEQSDESSDTDKAEGLLDKVTKLSAAKDALMGDSGDGKSGIFSKLLVGAGLLIGASFKKLSGALKSFGTSIKNGFDKVKSWFKGDKAESETPEEFTPSRQSWDQLSDDQRNKQVSYIQDQISTGNKETTAKFNEYVSKQGGNVANLDDTKRSEYIRSFAQQQYTDQYNKDVEEERAQFEQSRTQPSGQIQGITVGDPLNVKVVREEHKVGDKKKTPVYGKVFINGKYFSDSYENAPIDPGTYRAAGSKKTGAAMSGKASEATAIRHPWWYFMKKKINEAFPNDKDGVHIPEVKTPGTGRAGIRIHPSTGSGLGSEGCLTLGVRHGNKFNINESYDVWSKLMPYMHEAKDFTVTYTDPVKHYPWNNPSNANKVTPATVDAGDDAKVTARSEAIKVSKLEPEVAPCDKGAEESETPTEAKPVILNAPVSKTVNNVTNTYVSSNKALDAEIK